MPDALWAHHGRAGRPLTVLVPVKRLSLAKSRLSGALTGHQRQLLMEHMAAHVLETACRSRVGQVYVVGAGEKVRRLAARHGVGFLDDCGLGWNEALCHARGLTRAGRGAATMYLAADLPLVSASELRALARACGPRSVVVAQSKDGGTNALVACPVDVITPSFGVRRSASVHTAAAKLAGARVTVVDLPGLAADVDLPEDLHHLAQQLPWLAPAIGAA